MCRRRLLRTVFCTHAVARWFFNKHHRAHVCSSLSSVDALLFLVPKEGAVRGKQPRRVSPSKWSKGSATEKHKRQHEQREPPRASAPRYCLQSITPAILAWTFPPALPPPSPAPTPPPMRVGGTPTHPVAFVRPHPVGHPLPRNARAKSIGASSSSGRATAAVAPLAALLRGVDRSPTDPCSPDMLVSVTARGPRADGRGRRRPPAPQPTRWPARRHAPRLSLVGS